MVLSQTLHPALADPCVLLEQALQLRSLSGEERACAEYLVEVMATVADAAFVDSAGNAVAEWGSGPLAITFLGHIDTVPGHIPVRREGNILYGRGAVDAKGAMCTAIAAMARLVSQRPELHSALRLRLIGAVEEEAPSSKGARYALEHYPAADMLIIGEPSGWNGLTLGYKGRLVAKLEQRKANFHSAGDDSTAAADLAQAWQHLQHWAEQVNAEQANTGQQHGQASVFNAVQVALQSINSHSDGLMQQAEAVFGLRLPLHWPPERCEAALRHIWQGLELEHIAFQGHEPAYRAPRDTVLSRAFRVSIRAQGGQPRFKVKTGTSDMNVVAPHWQVPTLAYGPGDASLDHSPNEHIALGEYRQAIAVLQGALEHLAAQPRSGTAGE